MTQVDRTDEHRLITLGVASRMLGVKEVTLRHWANRGFVQVSRTPGGHRRFLWKQIHTLSQQSPGSSSTESQHQEERALQRIQQRLRRGGQSQQAWRQGIQMEARTRFRLFGRRLLSLLVRSGSEARPLRQIKEEARLLGNEYGMEMAAQGHPLTQTLSAFLFFRDSALDALPSELRRQAMAVADQAMLGVAEAYEHTTREALQ